MKYKSDYYPESRFGGFTNIDGTLVFYSRVQALLAGGDAFNSGNVEIGTADRKTVLDVGCGRGAYGEDPLPFRRDLRILQAPDRRVIGIDVDQVGASNPYLDEFRPLASGRWPVADQEIDLALADNVLEHLPDPAAFFSEARRVLKPGGWLCIRTPNLWSYVGLISRLTPNARHVEVLGKAKDQVKAQDVFPTLYRCNTLPALRAAYRQHGFEAVVYGYDAEPSYLSFSRLAYAFGVLHQRFAPGVFKVGLHAFGQLKSTVR